VADVRGSRVRNHGRISRAHTSRFRTGRPRRDSANASTAPTGERC
jgi:hypothetical protein